MNTLIFIIKLSLASVCLRNDNQIFNHHKDNQLAYRFNKNKGYTHPANCICSQISSLLDPETKYVFIYYQILPQHLISFKKDLILSNVYRRNSIGLYSNNELHKQEGICKFLIKLCEECMFIYKNKISHYSHYLASFKEFISYDNLAEWRDNFFVFINPIFTLNQDNDTCSLYLKERHTSLKEVVIAPYLSNIELYIIQEKGFKLAYNIVHI
jgi:hypothetical protein